MKFDSILPLIALFNVDFKFKKGEDRLLKLFKWTMWATLAIYTIDSILPYLVEDRSHIFFKYFENASNISIRLFFPALFLTITEATRVRFNHIKNF